MISLKEELGCLKADFVSLQTFLKEKITSMEIKIHEIESKICTVNRIPNDRVIVGVLPQELDNQTRNIIEELMWESTFSEAVLHVREIFKDNNSREKFLRSCLELVLEKDEQYRKMTGTLFGNLISQNVINQTNVFNSLSSVLLVIENSNNYNTKMWQNLTEILLPMITESHIKLLQLQRRAQTILKQEYYREFINNLNKAVEMSKKHKFKNKPGDSNNFSQSINLAQSSDLGKVVDKKDLKIDVPEALHEDCLGIDIQNAYDLESFTKYKPIFENLEIDETKCDVENLVKSITSDNVQNIVMQLKELNPAEMKSALEEIIDIGMQKEPEQRQVIGGLLEALISEDVIDVRQLLVAFCKSVLKVQRLVMNQNTRMSICESLSDILLPIFTEGKLKLNQLSTVASLSLPEETKTVLLWFMEKTLVDKGVIEQQPNGQTNAVSSNLIKRIRKYMIKGGLEEIQKEGRDDGDNEPRQPKKSFHNNEKREKPKQIEESIVENKDATEEQTEHDKFLSLKRKKLLKERIENTGDKMDIKIDDLLNDQSTKKLHESDVVEGQSKIDGQITETDQAPLKQPENLPSSAIKEKMAEIIEHLMQTGNMHECVTVVKETFNECQTDLVFKAAFEYTKDKPSEYRIQSGILVSEAFKHDPKRIGAQIMNTISLELGDFEDAPELWNGMAEIICPPILNGLIRFIDLKLLPKYFLHTTHCASLLLAIFKQIIQQRGPDWLEENWKKSKLDLSLFLPLSIIYKFIIENNLQLIVKEDELSYYKENANE